MQYYSFFFFLVLFIADFVQLLVKMLNSVRKLSRIYSKFKSAAAEIFVLGNRYAELLTVINKIF